MSQSEEKIKTVPVSFRLPENVYNEYAELSESLGIKRSAFFREVFESKSKQLTVLESDKTAQVQRDKLIFIFNKTSNNLNQIAKNLNSAHKRDVVDERLYQKTLNKLISIEQLLISSIKNS